MQANCSRCERPFEADDTRRRYCSHSCATAARNALIPQRVPPATRFWANVDRNGPVPDHRPDLGACWTWQGVLLASGYGQHWADGQRWRAHRYAWTLAHGPIPDALNVCHACDNRRCVNVAHLFLGTTVDHRADCIAKGRDARGERNGRHTQPERTARGEAHPDAKLTEEAIPRLRARHDQDGASYARLARETGMSTSALYAALTGRTWRHVASQRRSSGRGPASAG